MSRSNITHIAIESRQTVLSGGQKDDVALGAGADDIADTVFRHEPPTPLEMEQAIDRVEEALEACGLRREERGVLFTSDPQLRALLGSAGDGRPVTRDDVEQMFQRLASASLGHPGALGDLPMDRYAAARLLILRECMHHLGFDGLVLGTSSA